MKKVLIVDDEYLLREYVKCSVEWDRLGLSIAGEAEDGREAVEKAEKLRPDIMIMDINIPFMNGLEVSRRVKEILPDTQILILTAYGEFEYAREAIQFGAVSFLLKPLDPAELEKELENAARKIDSSISLEQQSIREVMCDLPYSAQEFLTLLRGRKYEEAYAVIDRSFALFEERQMSRQTVSYVTMDILVNFTGYLSELGVEISEKMSEEMAQMNQLACTAPAQEVKDRLLAILEETVAPLEQRLVPSGRKKVSEAKRYIEENYWQTETGLNQIAEKIGVNPSYLSNIFKKEYGCSLSRYLIRVRMEQGRKMMEETPDITVMEVAELVGYSDAYYFSKSFKSQYGITPSKYLEERKIKKENI